MQSKIKYIILSICSIILLVYLIGRERQNDYQLRIEKEQKEKELLYKNFTLPSNDEVNDVIEAVIYQDRLKSIKTQPFFKYLISKQLFKNDVVFKNDTSDFDKQSILNLKSVLKNHNHSECFFESIDSIYLIYQSDLQNNNKVKYQINPKLSNKLYVAEEIIDSLGNERKLLQDSIKALRLNSNVESELYWKLADKFQYHIYYFRIPLFSKDRNRVFLRVLESFSVDCVILHSYLIEKQEGKWKIIKKNVFDFLG